MGLVESYVSFWGGGALTELWERALCADRFTPTELVVQMDRGCKGGRLYRQIGWSVIFVCCTKKAIERILPIFQFSPPKKVLLSSVAMRHRKAEKLAPVADIRLTHP